MLIMKYFSPFITGSAGTFNSGLAAIIRSLTDVVRIGKVPSAQLPLEIRTLLDGVISVNGKNIAAL